MAVITGIAGYAAEMTERRRHLHRHPEPALACHETAEFVADRLRAFGTTEIEQGIAKSGLVAIIDGQGDGAGLHHPRFDFNDAVAPAGALFFARLVEPAQPAG